MEIAAKWFEALNALNSKTMEIRTKHVLVKAMEIGAKQLTKKGPFFGPQKRWASPVQDAAAVAGQIS